MLKDHYVNQSQAAEKLGVDRRTINRWIRSGKLEAERIGNEVLIKRIDLVGVKRSVRGRKPTQNRQSHNLVAIILPSSRTGGLVPDEETE